MLILSRKKAETIIIDENIFVTVLDITGNIVRLGISAPQEITIHREELYNKINSKKPRENPQNSA